MGGGRILNRYIRRELLPAFFLSMAVLTLALFLQKMFRLIEFAMSKGTPLEDTGMLLLYILPSFLVFTVPMSLLVASLTAFARLSADSEVTAMKASRLSLYAMIFPVMQVAVVLFLVTGSIAHFVAPHANYAFKGHLFKMVKARAMVGLDQGVFSSTFDGMVIYVDRMSSLDDIGGIFLADERSATEPYAITARNGRLITSPESFSVTLVMEHGTVHLQPRQDGSYTLMSFDTGRLHLDINRASLRRGSEGRDINETDSLELYHALMQAKEEGKPVKPLEMEIHKRTSIAYACLIFGLIGAPLGIRRARTGRSAGVAIAIGVILVYYLILGTGSNLAEGGALSPLAAYWVPNGVITAVALTLVIKKGNEINFGIGHRVDSLIQRLLARFRRKRTP
jgi:lipopolysaccharide export system permease protein